jgi:polysaccharide biosynthesis/export protein
VKYKNSRALIRHAALLAAFALGLPGAASAQIGLPSGGAQPFATGSAPTTAYPRSSAIEPASAPGVAGGSAATLPAPSQGAAATDHGRDEPVQLRDPTTGRETRAVASEDPAVTGTPFAPPPPNEFEIYVAQTLGKPVPRFGASLLVRSARDFAPPQTTTVPPDYVLNAGDTLLLRLSGSLDASLNLTLDSDGKVFVPKVGAVSLAGVRYGDAAAVLNQRIGRQFRNFKLSLSVAQLHGIRVYVTGYAASPGAYTLNSLSTLVNAVMAAGGPSAGGSFRSVELRRGDKVLSTFDLYDLLLNGDKSRDLSLQNEDVIYIAPVGPEVAITGSVNGEAIYEAKPGETLASLLKFAGGTSTLADTSRMIVSRLSNLDRNGWVQLNAASAADIPLARGDILRIVSEANLVRPAERQSIVVRLEGEVGRPGVYYLEPNATLGDLLGRAGGLTPRAYVFASELNRATVRKQQKQGFDAAVRDLELALAAAPLSAGRSILDNGADRSARLASASAVVGQLAQREPDGRLVLDLPPDATALPANIVLEDQDRIYIPPRPVTVGVFGAVYRSGSFFYDGPHKIGDYLAEAGGAQKIADRSQVFVVRANGAVLARGRGAFAPSVLSAPALPGDVIFVPVKTDPTTLLWRIEEVAAIVAQLGVGALTLKVLSQ